jgi:phosphate transport system permease protein
MIGTFMLMARKGKSIEKTLEALFAASAFLSVAVLAGIFLLLIVNALPAFREIPILNFLKPIWNPDGFDESSYGVLAMLISTVLVTVGALIFAVPIGIFTAAYMSEIAGPREREIIKPVIEILSGIPSVVVGFLGIVVLSPIIAVIFHLPNGLNALNGSILLGIMALPTIISISEDSIAMVPDYYKEASYALGANKWQTLFFVTIPAASSGILASIMLGMGRAIGETMTVLMATGNASAMPGSLFDSVRTMTATIAIELGEVPYDTTHYYALFAIGFFIFAITFIVNLLADYFMHKARKY